MINRERLLERLKNDEGFRSKAYWDVKQWTYGFGCAAPGKGAEITREEASKLLAVRMDDAISDFTGMFKDVIDKFNDVRAEAFINMIFNMGPGNRAHPERGGLGSFKNTLSLIFDHDVVDWNAVADNLTKSKWQRQVGLRANKLIAEIRTGTSII